MLAVLKLERDRFLNERKYHELAAIVMLVVVVVTIIVKGAGREVGGRIQGMLGKSVHHTRTSIIQRGSTSGAPSPVTNH